MSSAAPPLWFRRRDRRGLWHLDGELDTRGTAWIRGACGILRELAEVEMVRERPTSDVCLDCAPKERQAENSASASST